MQEGGREGIGPGGRKEERKGGRDGERERGRKGKSVGPTACVPRGEVERSLSCGK